MVVVLRSNSIGHKAHIHTPRHAVVKSQRAVKLGGGWGRGGSCLCQHEPHQLPGQAESKGGPSCVVGNTTSSMNVSNIIFRGNWGTVASRVSFVE
jgi:hypothetical protein